MTDDLEDPRLLTPDDDRIPERMQRWHELGLAWEPVPEFDRLAKKIADEFSQPFAMINLVGNDQYFTGLYVRPGALVGQFPSMESDALRVMTRDTGFCPHVIDRRLGMAIMDVYRWSRFSTNPVIDALGVRTYLGAPMVDAPRTGHSSGDPMLLGTVCTVGQRPHEWGEDAVDRLKDCAAEVVERIHWRAARSR